MNINIRNNADLDKKYIRFINWKLNQLQDKFNDLIYVEIFLNAEGRSPKIYSVNIRLGIPGNDLIIKEKSRNLWLLFQNVHRKVQQSLAKKKEWNLKNRVDAQQQGSR